MSDPESHSHDVDDLSEWPWRERVTFTVDGDAWTQLQARLAEPARALPTLSELFSRRRPE